MMKHKTNRGKTQIIRDLLYALQHTPTTTQLVYRVNTTDKFIKQWIPHLKRQGLVLCLQKSRGFETYLTPKGRELIKCFHGMDNLLKMETYEKEVTQ